MVIYKKMSLFDAPKESILVHACNAQGVWGSGIAKEMKDRFPEAYNFYHESCVNGWVKPGSFDDYPGEDNHIVSLITSEDYGYHVDDPDIILVNTTVALDDFCRYIVDHLKEDEIKIYSNKFNSGLFKVPWEQTEKILNIITNKYHLIWVVCEI